MARYATGKNSWGISDRSGFRYRLSDMKKEWTGLLVGKDEFELKHPQLEIRAKASDAQAVRDPRPDRTEPVVKVLLPFNPFKTNSGGSSPTVVTVTELGHGRSVSDIVRFRDVEGFDGLSSSTIQAAAGYSIQSIVNTDKYTISVSASATSGSVAGGGGFASAGPVTVEN
jgi:hypothetical protein